MEDDQNRGVAALPRELHDALRYSRWEKGLGVTDLMTAIEEYDTDADRFAAVLWLCREHGLPEPVKPVTLARPADDGRESEQGPAAGGLLRPPVQRRPPSPI